MNMRENSTNSRETDLDLPRGPRGRRPGSSNTRHAIQISARAVFAELGFEKATMRSIGRRAGVDPSLVIYFFESKDKLFHEAVVEALQFMIPPRWVFSAGPHMIAERLLAHVLSQWESSVNHDTLAAVMRAAVS